MSLQPSLRPQILIGTLDAPHTLDIFLDYVCPYSAKMAFKIESILKPLLGAESPYAGKVKVIFRLQVQPWHSMSTITHEAGLAALHVSPENFWTFSLALFKNQEDYFDIPSQDLTVRQVREQLAKLAQQVLPENAIPEFSDLLTFKGPHLNGGTAVTNDLKYNIKYSRQNNIHVSPSVLWDGLLQSQIESSWEKKDWEEFFASRISV